MTETDTKIALLLAYRAAGNPFGKVLSTDEGLLTADGVRWNPLDNDGHAFRLMVKLSLVPSYRPYYKFGIVGHPLVEEFHPTDSAVALRRAIVRTAAIIGEQS